MSEQGAVLLTISEVCRLARMCKRTYHRLQELDQGPAEIRIGRKVLIRRDTFEAWLRAREQPANVPAPDAATDSNPELAVLLADPHALRAALLAFEEREAAKAKTTPEGK